MKNWTKSAKVNTPVMIILIGIGLFLFITASGTAVMTSMILKENLSLDSVSIIAKVVLYVAAFIGAKIIMIKDKCYTTILIYGAAISIAQAIAGIVMSDQWGGVFVNTLIVIAGVLSSLICTKKSRKKNYAKKRSR